VWGGYFPTQHADVCLRAPFVDYVVRGHGEGVFLALLDALRDGGDMSGIAGLAYRAGDGRTVQNALEHMGYPGIGAVHVARMIRTMP